MLAKNGLLYSKTALTHSPEIVASKIIELAALEIPPAALKLVFKRR